MKVYNPKPLAPVAEQMLKDAGVEIVGSSGPTKEDLIKDVADVDVSSSGCPPTTSTRRSSMPPRS